MIDLLLDVRVEQGGFTLDVADRSRVEVLGLFGPSGAGKTTLLETIAGLRRPVRGAITVGRATLFSSSDGVDVAPRARRIGYVPQDVLLFPHMTVRGNLLYGRRASGPARLAGAGPRRAADAERDRPDEAAAPVTLGTVVDMLGIDGLLHRRVPELSGGERQRVALGRALMTAPALLLMDEPLAAVDRARRERILPYLLRVRRELHVPLVYVTHDAGELAEIADRVLVVVEGRLVQAGAPGDVLARR